MLNFLLLIFFLVLEQDKKLEFKKQDETRTSWSKNKNSFQEICKKQEFLFCSFISTDWAEVVKILSDLILL